MKIHLKVSACGSYDYKVYITCVGLPYPDSITIGQC